jgi:hypothetical protein
MDVGCVIFGMTLKKTRKDMQGTTVLKAGMRWQFGGNLNRHSSREIWAAYIEHVTSERFSRRSQSGAVNRNREIHGSVTTHTGGSIPFSAHAKRMVRLF